MKKIRRIKPGQKKRERRDAEAALKKKTAAFLDHPQECCVCTTPFERTKETVSSWHVSVIEGRVRMACPDCWNLVRQTVEKEQ
tara:strand:- start:8747 stop:8995 length:249 start_codon:yes stop_codon:yes gene_type:complete